MPSRKRGQEARRAARAAERSRQRAAAKAKRRRKRSQPKRARQEDSRSLPDPSDVPEAEIRFIQPGNATKSYRCPGCNGAIPPGMGHLVAVPPDDPDLRRHWHRGCWNNRHSRYQGP